VQTRAAFSARDVALAEDLVRQDREINRLNREIFRLAIEIGDDPDTREWAMHMTMVARALERVGDNAVDIGEVTAFIVTGQFRWTIWLGAISVGGRNGQAAATGHRIPRIDGKVQNDELDLTSVDHRRPQSLLKHRLDPNRGANSSEQKIAHSGNQGIQISWFRLKALSSRKCQQLPRQLGSPLRGLCCAGEISANFVVVSAAACKLQVASTPVNRLLKSWATPPVICPMSSIFCAC